MGFILLASAFGVLVGLIISATFGIMFIRSLSKDDKSINPLNGSLLAGFIIGLGIQGFGAYMLNDVWSTLGR